ncbi:CHAT domain-containing protein [Sphaerisporangium siamense]|uniref:Tetratricopeptide (TPR) repeat protein n=1 Tax=Sphaerisporangium siamense TaxID=795645 RepID=A0A7W7DFB5_9ACTN|nr:CHAT domain-containing protein [Sphaerisporangium siamense]MBB4705763.1 tetratricopeptide (TPR) repeat protein [Sphaerisporangium siamense]GII82850.1 CHAT domain-containing protein [Sphaerisporangium siamense]
MAEGEDHLAFVRARLQRVAATRDLSPVLDRAALVEAERLATSLPDDGAGHEALYLLGWLHFYRYLGLPKERSRTDLITAIAMFTPCFITGHGDLPEALLPVLADQTAPAVEELLHHVSECTDPALTSGLVRLSQRVWAATPDDHPDRAVRLSHLASALLARFHETQAMKDLDRAIETCHRALSTIPIAEPARAAILSDLANALFTRFRRAGTSMDLDHAIERSREALTITPSDHALRTTILFHLAQGLQSRFEHAGAVTDLDDAVRAGREALVTADAWSPGRIVCLAALGGTLLVRFQLTGAMSDLDEATEKCRQATADASPGDPHLALYLSTLGNALRNRFTRTQAMADLNNALEAGRQALAIAPQDHPHHATCLSGLAGSLFARFQRTGVMADLDETIGAQQRALAATPAGNPNHARFLANLGYALRARFEHTGAMTDLDEAIETGREAVSAIPPGHIEYPGILTNLTFTLLVRFERTGRTADLDEAVEAGRQALAACPSGHVQGAGILSNLGNALRARFNHTGSTTDLNAAIHVTRRAVSATPADSPDQAGFLSNLGAVLWARFERTGILADLDEAIEAGRQAVATSPADHPCRAMFLSNLGYMLLLRFGRTKGTTDLEESVEAAREAVTATPPGHIEHPGRLSNLAGSLQARFKRTGTVSDLDDAIEAAGRAVAATPADSPHRAKRLLNLGHVLKDRCRRTGTVRDLDAAVSAYADAVALAPAAASLRVQAARAGALLAASSWPGMAAGLLEQAVLLLPQIASRRLERPDQQHALGEFAGLGAAAAALALSDPGTPAGERPWRALRLLEAARAVLLSQALHTRSDLTDLHARHPELAARFVDLRDLLDRPTDPDGTTPIPATTAGRGERNPRDRIRAAEEFAALLEHIRHLEGFVSFALPPSVDELAAQAASGPVVVFNVSDRRGDALLLTSGGLTAIELPGLTTTAVATRVHAFHRALPATTAPDVPPAGRIGAQDVIAKTLAWLWDAVAGPVLGALGHHGAPAPGEEWPRVWWAPGGVLGLLPVHAAGHHADPPGPGRRTVLDRVVSSYTPTVTALRHARQRAGTRAPAATRDLIVGMPTTPGLPGQGLLPNVPAEIAKVRARLPHAVILTAPTAPSDPTPVAPHGAGPVPTAANVLTHLNGCAIAHFACHGVSDPVDPSNSRLLLHDHESDPLTVAALAPLTLDHARLAYLSACNTALTSANTLADEAIHLASAFQLAGFPHVIGTLWQINDRLAATIANAFYTGLTTRDGTLDTARAAHALHDAVRAARDRHPADPSLWAAHIHVGG